MTVYRVSTVSQFDAALKSARGGDSILLSGTFDKLILNTSKSGYGHINFGSKVTIASADAGRPAVVNELTTNGAGNIEFRNIKFDYNPAKTSTGPVFVQNGSKITFNNVEVEGHVSGGYGQGVGVRVRNSKDFAIVDSDITNFKNGFNFSNITGATIADNNFRGISNDGMIVGGLVGASITGNDFRNFKSKLSDKHKDAIQVNNGDGIALSRDVLIKDNVIVNPENAHGIFFGNKIAASGNRSAYYRDITIEDNYLHTAHKLGVTVEHAWNLKIRNNTIVQNFDIFKGGDQINVPVINVSSSSMYVTITGNKVPSVPDEANGTWTVSGNATGTRNILHWDSTIRASSLSAEALDAPEPEDVAPAAAAPKAVARVSSSDSGDEFRFNGKIAAAEARIAIEKMDFERGDTIVLRGFDTGSFAGKTGGNKLIVYDGGASVKLDSALDLQELVAFSRDVSARTSGDAVILRIEQNRGTAELALADLAGDFRAADQPDLF
jgi:hypothetical protein